MTRLSVNINKIATLRNARGGNVPDLIDFALMMEKYGAWGGDGFSKYDLLYATDKKNKKNIKKVLKFTVLI